MIVNIYIYNKINCYSNLKYNSNYHYIDEDSMFYPYKWQDGTILYQCYPR